MSFIKKLTRRVRLTSGRHDGIDVVLETRKCALTLLGDDEVAIALQVREPRSHLLSCKGGIARRKSVCERDVARVDEEVACPAGVAPVGLV